MVISILLKLHYDKDQFIVNHWWKFCSDRTRIKSILRRLKDIGVVCWKLYPNTLKSVADTLKSLAERTRMTQTWTCWRMQKLEGLKPNLIICSSRTGLLGLLICRQIFLKRQKVLKINLGYSKFLEMVVKSVFLCFRYRWVFLRSPVWQQSNMLQYRWILHVHL